MASGSRRKTVQPRSGEGGHSAHDDNGFAGSCWGHGVLLGLFTAVRTLNALIVVLARLADALEVPVPRDDRINGRTYGS